MRAEDNLTCDDEVAAAQAAALNDEFRRFLGMGALPGRVTITDSLTKLGARCAADILRRIARYDSFAEDGNHSERRRIGVLKLPGIETIAWRIYCYTGEDLQVEVDGSERSHYRILKVVLASDLQSP